MILILSIIVLVALVSLYDYFSTKSWQRVTSTVRNNVVFENRNKSYGAFVIRRDYDKALLIILGVMLFGVGGVSAAFASFSSVPKEVVAEVPKNVETEIEIELDLSDDKEKEKEPIDTEKDVPPSQEEVVANVPPVVVTEVVETKVLTQEQLDALKTGSEAKEKIGDGLTTTTTTTTKEKEKEKEVVKTPIEFPTKEAMFIGGQPAMAKFIQMELEYPDIAKSIDIQGKCYLRFIVGADGKISSVKVVRGISGCPECDLEAIRVLKSMPPWEPAELNGEKVPSIFNMSINFVLD